MAERNVKRKTREQISKKRTPSLGYYIIVTDTKQTEANYIIGLRNSLPEDLRDRIVIVVQKTETENLVQEAENQCSLHPQYAQPWIVFDRDDVNCFDDIIQQAQNCGINVGWSNPCIEIWFSAYFGKLPTCINSVDCCKSFSQIYKKKTGRIYDKADKDIYKFLCKYGDEQKAIKTADARMNEHIKNGYTNPSKINPGTTVQHLVKEIRDKVQL